MARLSSRDADYARRRAAHEEERRMEFYRRTGRSTRPFFQISQRDAQAFNRAFERGMQQQMRVAGMIGVVGTVGVGGVHRLQGLAGQVAYPSVRTLGLSGGLGVLSGFERGLSGDYIGYDALSGVEFGIYAPVIAPFLISDALVFEGMKRLRQ